MRLGDTNTRYGLEQIVYLRVNPEVAGIITSITSLIGGSFYYTIVWGDDRGESSHFEPELTDERQYHDGVREP